jgi:hypothetical protein
MKCRKPGTRDTWQNHKVGPENRPADTHHILEGVNRKNINDGSELHHSGDSLIRKRHKYPGISEVPSR